jgi:hypothetical protein
MGPAAHRDGMNLVSPHRWTGRAWTLGMTGSLLAVVLLTLTPRGNGWAWGAPLDEARWYLTGLDSTETMLQLVGNLLLLAVPFGLAVARWPALGRFRLLCGLSLAGGTTIEFLQWALPLGRVVSPLDAVLNATGAVAAGLVVAHGRAMGAHRWLLPEQYLRSLSREDDDSREPIHAGSMEIESVSRHRR